METTEYFSDFINGNLNETSENNFFGKLSTDLALREEFRCFLTITDSIKTNRKQFTPSSASTKAVFGSLGLNPTIMTPAITPKMSNSTFWTSKLFVGATSSIVTILLLLSSYLFFNKEDERTLADNKAVVKGDNNNLLANQPISSETNSQTPSQTIIKYIVLKNDKPRNIVEEKEIPVDNISYSIIGKSDLEMESDYLNSMSSFDNQNLTNIIIPDDVTNISNEENCFELEVNNSLFWNLPEETISPKELAKLYNSNIFIYYSINKALSVGLGVRQETFYVKYNVIDEYSRNFVYEQQPNLTSYECSIRYIPFDFNLFVPFIQLNMGGSRFGYTYRFGFGSGLRLSENLTFNCLFEYANLVYNHNEVSNSASKVGINYGINYNF